MVSKASDDLPDPDRPVNTTSLSRGIDSVTFLRLCSRAPRIVIWSVGMNLESFLISGDRKRRAGRGHEPAVAAFDPALGHRRAPAGVDDVTGGSERLPHLRGVDEVELQVKAHGTDDARTQRTQRPPHGGVGEGADHAAVHETGVVGHVFGRGHLYDRRAFAGLDELKTQPLPGARRSVPTLASQYLPTWWGGHFSIHGPDPPARACTSTRPERSAGPVRRRRRPR